MCRKPSFMTIVPLTSRHGCLKIACGKRTTDGKWDLELFCNRPEFFLFGTNTSGVGVKRQVTLGQGDLKVTLHLCRLSLNPSIYNALQAKRKSRNSGPIIQWSEARSVRFRSMDGPPSSWKTCLWARCRTG